MAKLARIIEEKGKLRGNEGRRLAYGNWSRRRLCDACVVESIGMPTTTAAIRRRFTDNAYLVACGDASIFPRTPVARDDVQSGRDAIPVKSAGAAHSILLPGAAAPTFDADALLNGRPEIQLAFRGQVYRLRCTKQGKLILTK